MLITFTLVYLLLGYLFLKYWFFIAHFYIGWFAFLLMIHMISLNIQNTNFFCFVIWVEIFFLPLSCCFFFTLLMLIFRGTTVLNLVKFIILFP